ncbi:hypothetical protein BESB_064720 [Besnoitia besnoiti]|uniref:Transmembrane protein n=1 Tax=Besnoitia besnoiti TaxID=94643 RepID=A0A2A9MDU7_BESBE|nr:hypothetical protein BESB_064720 [Besnoitia besnoiti]PFH34441.1 hypothetical protein BESB_064720 [Besnoitia besnoiti]
MAGRRWIGRKLSSKALEVFAPGAEEISLVLSIRLLPSSQHPERCVAVELLAQSSPLRLSAESPQRVVVPAHLGCFILYVFEASSENLEHNTGNRNSDSDTLFIGCIAKDCPSNRSLERGRQWKASGGGMPASQRAERFDATGGGGSSGEVAPQPVAVPRLATQSDRQLLVVAGILNVLVPVGTGALLCGLATGKRQLVVAGVCQIVTSLIFVGIVWSIVTGVLMIISGSELFDTPHSPQTRRSEQRGTAQSLSNRESPAQKTADLERGPAEGAEAPPSTSFTPELEGAKGSGLPVVNPCQHQSCSEPQDATPQRAKASQSAVGCPLAQISLCKATHASAKRRRFSCLRTTPAFQTRPTTARAHPQP